ncbi:MAG TPA: hypothetical protein PLV92_15310, partial [Pirellulaceae bacterium]|nr:hypothetical protein [Pirellulaceae bacterium]
QSSLLPLVWALDERMRGEWRRFWEAHGRLTQPAETLPGWLAGLGERTVDASLALEALSWARLLAAGVRVEQGLRQEFCAAVAKLAEAAGGDSTDGDSTDGDSTDDDFAAGDAGTGEATWLRMLLDVELPVTLVSLPPTRVAAARQTLDVVGDKLEGFVDEAIDAEGLPLVHTLPHFRPLLASWIRSLQLAHGLSVDWPDDNLRSRFELTLYEALRLFRWDGSQVFDPLPAVATDLQANVEADVAMWTAGLELVAQTEHDRLARIVSERIGRSLSVAPRGGGKRKRSRGKTDESGAQQPIPSGYAEASQLASLRTDWTRDGAHFALGFHAGRVFCELNARRETVFSGEWTSRLIVDGREIEPVGDWQEHAWAEDEDADLLELRRSFADGWSLERQVILLRDGRLLLIDDTLVGERHGLLEYSASVPLAPNIHFQSAAETTEAVLWGRTPLAMALPLYLPEWREEVGHVGGSTSSDTLAGELTFADGRMVWTRRVSSNRLHLPLAIACDGRTSDSQYTWRRLTVTERMMYVPDSVAAGYRIQLGGQQWLIYRSVAPIANRAVLGENLSCKYYVGGFHGAGKNKPLAGVD